ncbi:MAG TPA: hypothetical protein VFR87_06250 [Nocardioidaceae bacterium]|nr:hypothetical protein [Nocardioidaceae bacterium]
MLLSSLIKAAAETHGGEPAIHPYWIGAIALGLLLSLLVALLAFGKGREHS